MTEPLPDFTPGGRTHTILARLAQSPCKAGYLFRALGYPNPLPSYRRKKFWRLMDVLQAHSLVFQKDDAEIVILPAGERLLERLDLQAQATQQGAPNVRIFDRRAA